MRIFTVWIKVRVEDSNFVVWRNFRWRLSSKMAAGGSGDDAFQTFYTEVRLKNNTLLHTHRLKYRPKRVKTHGWEALSSAHTNTRGRCVKPSEPYIDNTTVTHYSALLEWVTSFCSMQYCNAFSTLITLSTVMSACTLMKTWKLTALL